MLNFISSGEEYQVRKSGKGKRKKLGRGRKGLGNNIPFSPPFNIKLTLIGSGMVQIDPMNLDNWFSHKNIHTCKFVKYMTFPQILY